MGLTLRLAGSPNRLEWGAYTGYHHVKGFMGVACMLAAAQKVQEQRWHFREPFQMKQDLLDEAQALVDHLAQSVTMYSGDINTSVQTTLAYVGYSGWLHLLNHGDNEGFWTPGQCSDVANTFNLLLSEPEILRQTADMVNPTCTDWGSDQGQWREVAAFCKAAADARLCIVFG